MKPKQQPRRPNARGMSNLGDHIPTLPPPRQPIRWTGTTGARDVFAVVPEHGSCPSCGAPLELYEIFACRIRGLKRPVCLGCLIKVLVFLRDDLLPLVRGLEQKVLELADKIPYERLGACAESE